MEAENKPTERTPMAEKAKRIIIYIAAGLLLLIGAAVVYFFIATGGRPVGYSELEKTNVRLDTAEAKASTALETANSAYQDLQSLVGMYQSKVYEDSTQSVDIASVKRQIALLRSGSAAGVDPKAREDIEKLKNVWQSNISYIAKKDSASKAEREETLRRIDSIASAGKTINPNQPQPNPSNGGKNIELPDDQKGDGQKPPQKKEGKKKFFPKNNDKKGKGYQNYNKDAKK